MTKSKRSVSHNLKRERLRVPLRPKTLRREKTEKHSLQLPRRKKNQSKKQQSKLLKIRKLQSRKGLLVVRAAKSPLAPLHHRLGALQQPSLVTLTTRGLTKTDTRARRGEWTSPQKRGRRRKGEMVEGRRRKATRRSSAPLRLGEGDPGLPLPPRTLTTARPERSSV